jgi:hypothetical protein
LIGSINFEAFATVHAVAFVPLPGDYRQPLSSKQGLKMKLWIEKRMEALADDQPADSLAWHGCRHVSNVCAYCL